MPSKCVLAAIVFLSLPAAGQRMYSNGAIEPSYRSAQEAAEAERHLESHPDDRQIVQRLLDYHVAHWQSAGADRLRVVLWTIEHHPGIDLEGVHDSRGLILNPDEREGYQQARNLWLKQVRRFPDNPRVLENAATCLRLSDRESAVNWLQRAMVLNLDRASWMVSALADVYAAAIAGVTGMNPWLGPTSVDPAEASSAFARRARTAAGENAEIAARTGWALRLTTEAFHRLKLSEADYDALAEELLLESAAMDYPRPARFPFLGDFYRHQAGKRSGRIVPEFRVVAVGSEEQARRLVSRTMSHTVTGEKASSGPVRVAVDIVVGIDGHVWQAQARNAPSELIASAAAGVTRTWLYQPLREQGEPVRVATTVEVILDLRP